jgi:hypothetical protein
MPRICLLFMTFLLVPITTGSAFAAGPAATMLDGCKQELQTKCQNVTPGEGRILACLYAYQDQLSGQCEMALYNGAVQLQQAVMALTLVASECHDDLLEYCANVEIGEGRVLSCLEQHAADVSPQCKQAVKAAGQAYPVQPIAAD